MGRRSRAALGLALVAGALLVAAMRVTTRSTSAGVRLGAPWAMGDFRNTVYYPVRFFLEGGNPYDRAAYAARYPNQEPFPPFLPGTLLIHAPFGMLPLVPAELCYAALILLLTGVTAWLALRFTGTASAAAVPMIVGLILLSRPGQWNLLHGQVTLLAVIASYVALRYARQVPWLSGLALGFSTFKPTFGVPLAALMLVRGDIRAVTAGVLAGVALNLPIVAVLVSREGGVHSFVESMRTGLTAWTGNGLTGHRWSESKAYNAESIHRIDLLALTGRLVPGAISGAGELMVTTLVLLSAALIIRRIAAAPDRLAHLSDSVICTAVLLGMYHLGYDLLLLVLPMAALVRGRVPGVLQRPAIRWLMLGTFAVLATNYVSTGAVVDRLGRDRTVWLALTSINPLLLLVLLIAYSAVALEATRSVRAPSGLGGVAAR
jgi:hypothetical protein